MNILMIGQNEVSVIITILLMVIFKFTTTVETNDKLKTGIALLCGIGFGVLAIFMNDITIDFKNIVNYIINGFLTGAASIGLYKAQQIVRN